MTNGLQVDILIVEENNFTSGYQVSTESTAKANPIMVV